MKFKVLKVIKRKTLLPWDPKNYYPIKTKAYKLPKHFYVLSFWHSYNKYWKSPPFKTLDEAIKRGKALGGGDFWLYEYKDNKLVKARKIFIS
jgi:hypothetical protein